MNELEKLIERDRGILTKHDRKYLLDRLDESLSDNAEYQKRHQIRERIRNAIYDFQIITGELEPRDIDQIFKPADKWAQKARHLNEQGRVSSFPDFPSFIECWSAMIQFFVYSQLSTNIAESRLLARWTIEQGVSRALRQYGFDFTNEYYKTDVTLNWSVDQRFRLLFYIEHIESQIPQGSADIEEYLYRLYQKNYLPYHLALYLFEKHVESEDGVS